MSDEAFARDVLKIAVAQACNQMDFTNIEAPALETLIDLMRFYFTQVGIGAATNAALAGRSECNYFDIKRSLEELGILTMEELMRFNDMADVLQWSRESVNHFMPAPSVPPTIRDPIDNFPAHIPSFLPPFPDHRTYQQTPLYNERESDPKQLPKQKLAQRVEAENNLSRLHTREVGQRNIINYDQIYDPRSTKQTVGPFQPAKDPVEIASASEHDPVHPGPSPTAVDPERVQQLLDPKGETQHLSHYQPNERSGTEVDPDTQRRIDRIISLQHNNGTLQGLTD